MNSIRSGFFLCFLVSLLLGRTLAAAERFHIVNVEDHLGESTTQVVSQSELMAMQEDIRQETRFYMQALARAQAKWRQEGRKENFPKTEIRQRKVTSTNSFASRAEAQEKVSRKESRAEEKQKEEDKKKKDDKKKSDKDKEDPKIRREQEKQRQLKEALGYYETELQALKAAAEAPKKDAPAP